jgi:hypothetical protein
MSRLFNRLWYVYPPVVLAVAASPAACLRALAEAARPSQQRLHLRNLFAGGRRYYLQPRQNGFYLTSNSKIPWGRRARTSFAALMEGQFSDLAGGTQIRLRARMRLFFFLDIFLIPAFISSILIFAPWSRALIAGLMLALFGLSWLWHRLTATLQAADMVYFVQKALEDLEAFEMPGLQASAPEVITQHQEFREAWQKFYEQHKEDPPPNGSVS